MAIHEKSIAKGKAFVENLNVGTLAIDLGNTTTVVAFQGEQDKEPKLLDLNPISRIAGEVPSLIWYSREEVPDCLVGVQVINSGLSSSIIISSWLKKSYFVSSILVSLF